MDALRLTLPGSSSLRFPLARLSPGVLVGVRAGSVNSGFIAAPAELVLLWLLTAVVGRERERVCDRSKSASVFIAVMSASASPCPATGAVYSSYKGGAGVRGRLGVNG